MGSSAALPPAEQALVRTQDTGNNLADFAVQAASPRNAASAPAPDPNPSPDPDPTPDPEPDPTPDPEPDPNPEPDPDPEPVPPAGPPPASTHRDQPLAAPAYSSKIMISEIMPNPDGADAGEEWVELYNSSNEPVDLTGWILDDKDAKNAIGSSAVKLAGQTIAARGYLVVTLPEGAFTLNNSGEDAVRLFWPNKKLVQNLTYTGKAKDDYTYAFKGQGTFAWTAFPTPGLPNQFVDSSNQTTAFSPALESGLGGSGADDLLVLEAGKELPLTGAGGKLTPRFVISLIFWYIGGGLSSINQGLYEQARTG